MARGGRRAGTPGTAYGQRTDLNLPPTAPTGQPYGVAGAQIAAQQAVPMGAPPAPAGTGAPPPAPSPGGGAPPILPGGLGHIARPTERPNEPVTAGVPMGPGPGPAAIPGWQPQAPQAPKISDVLASVAASSGMPEITQLANRAKSLGQ